MIDRNADILDRLLYAEPLLRGPAAPLVKDCIKEVKALRAECQRLANFLMHEKVFVHEQLIAELDEVLKPYLGGANE